MPLLKKGNTHNIQPLLLMRETLLKQIALTLIPGVGPVSARNLVSYCGGVEAVFREKKLNLEKIPSIGPLTAKAIVGHKVFERAEEECRFIEQNNLQTFFYLDQKYPKRLKNCHDAPLLLYFKGNADLNAEKIIGIVGTRNATAYGKSVTEQIVKDLGRHQVMIMSGLAYGIDICAHKASVLNNITNIGVLAHGLDMLYPGNHKTTAQKMLSAGGLLTEFPSKTNPDRENFPSRNRIVAGMCDAILVIESAEKGGALITADVANSYNRDVFAVPGNINNIYSSGCNKLIKENKAGLVETAEDIIKMMQWENEERKPVLHQQKLFLEFSGEEKLLLDILNEEPAVDLDTIAFTSKIPLGKVSALLLKLELSGVVKALPGKQFQLA